MNIDMQTYMLCVDSVDILLINYNLIEITGEGKILYSCL